MNEDNKKANDEWFKKYKAIEYAKSQMDDISPESEAKRILLEDDIPGLTATIRAIFIQSWLDGFEYRQKEVDELEEKIVSLQAELNELQENPNLKQ